MEYQSFCILPLVCYVLTSMLTGALGQGTDLGCTLDFEKPFNVRNPNHDEGEDAKVFFSDYVVFGVAGRTVKSGKVPALPDGVRTIEFDVVCVYRRIDPVPVKILITGIGNKRNQIPGCPPAPLKSGQSATMYLKKVAPSTDLADNLFQVEFAPNSDNNVPNNQKLDDLTLYCDLALEKPQGMLEELDEVCVEQLGEEYCFRFEPENTTTAAPTTTPQVVTAKPKTMDPNPKPVDSTTQATKTNPTKGVDVKPVKGGDKDSYSTQNGEEDKTGPSGNANINIISQSLVLLISALYVLV